MHMRYIPCEFGRVFRQLIFCMCFVVLAPALSETRAADYAHLIEQASEARNAGNFAKSEQLLRDALSIAPDSAEAGSLLALVIAFQNRNEEALRLIEEISTKSPEDRFARITYARILSFSGQYSQSIRILNPFLQGEQRDRDALVLAGRIQFFQSDLPAARAYYSEALELEPDFAEAQLGLVDVALAEQNVVEAEQRINLLQDVPDENVRQEVRERAERLEAIKNEAAPVWALTLGVQYSDLDRTEQESWKEVFAYILREQKDKPSVTLFLHSADRFADRDNYGEIRIDHKVSPGVTPYGFAGVGPASDFLPRWQVGAGTAVRLFQQESAVSAGVANVELRRSQYKDATVDRFSITYDQYVYGESIILSPGAIAVFDDENGDTVGWTVAVTGSPTETVKIGTSYTDSPDSSDGQTVDTRSIAAFTSFEVNKTDRIRIDGSVMDRERSFRRSSVSVSVTRRF